MFFLFELEYFLNESYGNAFHETKIFTFCENQYAILTRACDQKIISWFNNNDTNYINSEPLVKVYTKYKQAWVEFIKGGSVKYTGGENKNFGVEIPDDLAPKMEKIKTIASTVLAFAVLLENGDVFAWGKKEYGGLIPDEIQIKLKNIKMIYSNKSAFIAISKDGKAYSWGCPSFAGAIVSEIENVKMIFSTDLAFAALLNDGNVRTWGIYAGERIFSEVQAKLKNVKMIFSDSFSFVALLQRWQLRFMAGRFLFSRTIKKIGVRILQEWNHITIKNMTLHISPKIIFSFFPNYVILCL